MCDVLWSRGTNSGRMLVSGVTSYGALGHVPPLELVQVVIFTLHVDRFSALTDNRRLVLTQK